MLMENLQKFTFLFLILLFLMFSYNEVSGQGETPVDGLGSAVSDIGGGLAEV